MMLDALKTLYKHYKLQHKAEIVELPTTLSIWKHALIIEVEKVKYYWWLYWGQYNK